MVSAWKNNQRPTELESPNIGKMISDLTDLVLMMKYSLSLAINFDLKMRFAPQWRAIFHTSNFKKRSEAVVFFAF